MLKNKWDSHNLLHHNNMSWIKGDEPMVNIKLKTLINLLF